MAEARPLDEADCERALRNCYRRSWRVAFLLLYDLGLRRAEVCNLRWDEHVEASGDGSVWVRSHGKGSKRRKLVCTRRLAEDLKAWQGAHGSSACWVIPNQHGQQMSRNRMSRLAAAVLLGHGSLATTMRYLGVNEDDISTAILGAPVGRQGRSLASRGRGAVL